MKPGDVVFLKSGGPPMTVTDVVRIINENGTDGGEAVEVAWFKKNGSMAAGTFRTDHLQLAKDPEENGE